MGYLIYRRILQVFFSSQNGFSPPFQSLLHQSTSFSTASQINKLVAFLTSHNHHSHDQTEMCAQQKLQSGKSGTAHIPVN